MRGPDATRPAVHRRGMPIMSRLMVAATRAPMPAATMSCCGPGAVQSPAAYSLAALVRPSASVTSSPHSSTGEVQFRREVQPGLPPRPDEAALDRDDVAVRE